MADFGVLGLAVMGSNLAENVEDNGYSVAVWNLEPEVTDEFATRTAGKKFTPTKTLSEFVGALERPRRILLMIKAGNPVDQVLGQLKPLLDEGDIVIDGGNSLFKDTRRRATEMKAAGFHFVGMGVSGGEEGARHGPSLMPGGSAESYARLQPILEAISAKAFGEPCVTHIGEDGAGHFVKMVHNGIEYGDMQVIAEVYDFLHRIMGLPISRVAEIFAEWNKGELNSFLIEIAAKILTVMDDDGQPLVEKVLDHAGQKGTGRWTVMMALELGIALPTISAAQDARVISSAGADRALGVKRLRGPSKKKVAGDPEKLIAAAHDALLFGRICAYAQGMELISAGSDEYKWKINRQDVAKIWRGGCIIRSTLLDLLMKVCGGRRPPRNLILAPGLARICKKTHRSARRILKGAQDMGMAAPALSASLAYHDGLRTEHLPQNLTQAQRDAFGAHTYRRVDRDESEIFHTHWLD